MYKVFAVVLLVYLISLVLPLTDVDGEEQLGGLALANIVVYFPLLMARGIWRDWLIVTLQLVPNVVMWAGLFCLWRGRLTLAGAAGIVATVLALTLFVVSPMLWGAYVWLASMALLAAGAGWLLVAERRKL